jgi:hypothetical protein
MGTSDGSIFKAARMVHILKHHIRNGDSMRLTSVIKWEPFPVEYYRIVSHRFGFCSQCYVKKSWFDTLSKNQQDKIIAWELNSLYKKANLHGFY